MRQKSISILMTITLVALVGCSASAAAGARQPTPALVTPTPSPPVSPAADPFSLISQESLFASMEDLTAIQPYSGWRNSATQGEAEALDYVAGRLGELAYLGELGLEVARQTFPVFMTTELWETRLHLTLDGREVEVPADGIRGHRDAITRTLRFDSDGAINDSGRDPVSVEGPPVLVRSTQDIKALSPADVAGRVALVDYAVVDPSRLGKPEAAENLSRLLAKRPAGLVLVTQFSNQKHASHGTFVGDGSAFDLVEEAWAPPTLYARLEDMSPAGVQGWDDLAHVEAVRLTWDTDVFSPAKSGNLVARIPGADPSKAVILGAHIDSPNSPGAMDDGSGSVVLLELARVLDAACVQPPSDVYLVWFGSEELGLYGSYHFVSTHQALLDRTLAMLQIDMLSHPLDGIQAGLDLVTWSYGRLGDERLAWPEYLAGAAAQHGVETHPQDHHGIESDNTGFTGFGVPNANLVYKNDREMMRVGPIHYAAHIHDPYDTPELAREVGDVLEQMAHVALTAALETGRDAPELRVAPRPERRALFVASHTEPVHMSPTAFTDLGMTLLMAGFDVDMVPYGQAVTRADLQETDLVVALPVVDYPSPNGDPDLYDTAWSQEEIAALEAYVAGGGLLVLTNSAYRLKYGNSVLDPNEDRENVNALAGRFGVTYEEGMLPPYLTVGTRGECPLLADVTRLALAEGNGVPFTLNPGVEGVTLAQVEGALVTALVDYGDAGGQVLVLADVGTLGAKWGPPVNLSFWRNLAEYARSRK